MPVINQLPTVASTALSGSDNIPVYSSANGDARKLSLSGLLAWFRANFTNSLTVTNLQTPGDGFNITLTQDSQNAWLLLRPTGALATGTIVLPATAVCADGQTIIFTTTNQVAALTINGNGSTVQGAPTVLAADDKFTLKYNLQTTSWYVVA